MKVLFLFTVCLASALTEELAAVKEFAKGNIEFTGQVYKEVQKKQEGNFMISPLSVDLILALTEAGARGETAEQITKGLSLPTLQKTEEAIESFRHLLRSSSEKLTLSLANKIFTNEGFNIKENFQTLAENIFEAGVSTVDFSKSEEAINIINNWVANKTNNEITNLLRAGSVDPRTDIVLVNALHFMGKWDYNFKMENTQKAKFYTTKTDAVDVDMMWTTGYFGYLEEDGVQYLEMDYAGNTVSMTIIMPNEIEGLSETQEKIETLFESRSLPTEKVEVRLPKWTTETSTDFKDILVNLGVKNLFTSVADLSGISDDGLFVSNVIQKTFVNVNEEGTQASAATAVVLPGGPSPVIPNIQFTADHPFMYVIREKNSGIVLFAGRVTK